MEDLFPLESNWVLAVAAGALMLVMLFRLARPLPLQNVLFIAFCLLVGETLLELLVVKIGKIDLPDARWRYFLGAALLWTAVILVARRLAKFIARPWRKERVHWIWILALSTVGVTLFQIGWPVLDPDFAMQKAVAGMAAVRGVGTALLLLILTPWFIRKTAKPGEDEFSELADQPKKEAQQQAQEQTSN